MPELDQKLLNSPEDHLLLEPAPEERLREQIEALRREVEDLKKKGNDKGKQNHPDEPKRPQRRTLWIIGAVLLVVLLAAFFLGWLPSHNREKKLEQEAQAEANALPQVNFVLAQNSAPTEELLLPGTTEALTDAPLLARADGYVTKRFVDIGDRVKKGQLLALIAAPDLDQQVAQARAQLSQGEAALREATANLQQGHANEALARLTAARYDSLVRRGAVARQDNDTQQANYQAQLANLEALNHAVTVADENVASANANLQRLIALQGFERVTAPFDGVVTLRNTDVGAYISTGLTLLFRVAQTDVLRTYINVPQPNAPTVHLGQEAQLLQPEFGARQIIGHVTRTADALDPSSRTLLTEVQVQNRDNFLHPGMFVQVNLKNVRTNPPILIPGDSVIADSNGTRVAVIRDAHEVEVQPKQADSGTGDDKKSGGKKKSQPPPKPQKAWEGTIHLQQVEVGRDYGAATEIYAGLKAGDRVIVSPNDSVAENAKVQGLQTKAILDVQTGTAASKPNANSEKLQPERGGEKPSPQPSNMDKKRGPGY